MEQNNPKPKKKKDFEISTIEKKRKIFKPYLEQTLDHADINSLFYKYWINIQNKKQPLEFDARKDNE